MNHVSVFFNTRIENPTTSFNLANVSLILGSWFLLPARCLFHGHKVTICTKSVTMTVDHENEYTSFSRSESVRDMMNKPKRNFLRIALSIVFLVPGLLLGSFFKALGYFLSPSTREGHQLAIQHYTPADCTIGDENDRLTLKQIKKELRKIDQYNPLHQPIQSLIIYAEPGTEIKEDIGILSINPQKIILDGAQLIHGPSASMDGCLDERLDASWKSPVNSKTAKLMNNSSFAQQWRIDSVEDALQDTPPRRSLFSWERYKRIYVVY